MHQLLIGPYAPRLSFPTFDQHPQCTRNKPRYEYAEVLLRRGEVLPTVSDTPRSNDLSQHIAPQESSFCQTYERGREFGVKKELLDRLHKTKDQSNPKPTKKQHNKTQTKCNLWRSSESQEGMKKVRPRPGRVLPRDRAGND